MHGTRHGQSAVDGREHVSRSPVPSTQTGWQPNGVNWLLTDLELNHWSDNVEYQRIA
jgi:hypothetical protein